MQAGVLERGAQPSAEALHALKAAGIRTIVDLRDNDRTDERILVASLGMHYVNIPSQADSPSDANMAKFLAIVSQPANWPVFVHCRQGRDRTGTASAVYRMIVQGWPAEKAIEELQQHQGINALLFPQIPRYLRAMDVAKLRATVSRFETTVSERSDTSLDLAATARP